MQMVYMPHIALGNVEEINIGDVKIWNFHKKATAYISDQILREHISEIIKSNIYEDNPITDVGIISIGSIDFRQFSQDELRTVQEASLLLFLSCLTCNSVLLHNPNGGHFMRTSENFDLQIQNFQPSDLNIAETSGFIVRCTRGGHKIGEKKFVAPSCILHPIDFRLDEELVEYTLRLKGVGGKRLFGRIIGAAELFRQSYYNHDNVSVEARVLLQIAAFEILLELSRQARRDFKGKVEKYCKLPGEQQYTYTYEVHGKKERERRTRKGIWADKFYTLRNHVIHGDKIRARDFIFMDTARHIDIAPMFFVLIIKNLINEKLNSHIFYDEITWSKEKIDQHQVKGFEYEPNIIRKALTEAKNVTNQYRFISIL